MIYFITYTPNIYEMPLGLTLKGLLLFQILDENTVNYVNFVDTYFHGLVKWQTRKSCIGVVMVGVLAQSAVDRGFEPRQGQTKDYKIGICCFSAKHASLRSKSKDWLARYQNNVSEWSDMSTRGLLFH